MRANVTYQAGKSYTVGGHTFKEGKIETIDDASLIAKLKGLPGFAVTVLPEPKDPPVPTAPGQKLVRKVIPAKPQQDDD